MSHAERGLLLLGRERFAEAESEFRLAIAEAPGDAVAHARLALCLTELGKLDAAEAEAGNAVAMAPDQALTHWAKGQVLIRRNRFPQAEVCAQEAIRLDPADPDLRSQLAGIRARQTRWAECLAIAREGIGLDPDHLDCLNLAALALTHLNRTDEAEATLRGALQRAPANSVLHTNQGWTRLHHGDHRAALTHFREALRLDPGNDWARQGLLTAIKAGNPVYRRLLDFSLWVSRMGRTYASAIFLGSFVAYILITSALADTPLFWPALVLLFSLFLLTWVADPLANLALRFHPVGRHTLDRGQRISSALVAGTLALALAEGVCWYLWPWPFLLIGAFLTASLCMPLSHLMTCSPGWPRRSAIWLTSVLAGAVIHLPICASWLVLIRPAPGEATLLLMSCTLVMQSGGFLTLGGAIVVQLLGRATPTR